MASLKGEGFWDGTILKFQGVLQFILQHTLVALGRIRGGLVGEVYKSLAEFAAKGGEEA